MTVGEFCSDRLNTREGGAALIEEHLVQHPEFASFNPSSVNTVRLYAIQRKNGEVELICGFLRIGREGSLVDNMTLGGIGAPVDLETGVLGRANNGLPDHIEYPVHPDHGTPIEGARLHRFDEIKALARSCLLSFPHTRYAGVDIALSTDGPVVLEMNVKPDPGGATVADVPLGRYLSE